MWAARNKSDGKVMVFSGKPRRYHDGYFLQRNLKGLNDSITVGDGKDTYSYWIDRTFRGLDFWGSEEKLPKCLSDLKWTDEPIRISLNIV